MDSTASKPICVSSVTTKSLCDVDSKRVTPQNQKCSLHVWTILCQRTCRWEIPIEDKTQPLCDKGDLGDFDKIPDQNPWNPQIDQHTSANFPPVGIAHQNQKPALFTTVTMLLQDKSNQLEEEEKNKGHKVTSMHSKIFSAGNDGSWRLQH